MPRSPDLAIFVLTTDRQTTDRRQTKPITLPLAHARGVINYNVPGKCCYIDLVHGRVSACNTSPPMVIHAHIIMLV